MTDWRGTIQEAPDEIVLQMLKDNRTATWALWSAVVALLAQIGILLRLFYMGAS